MDGHGTLETPVVVTMPRSIDVASIDVTHNLLSVAFLRGARLIIVDLTHTFFCDVAGVRLLLAAREHAAVGGAQLRLVLPPGPWSGG